MIKKVAAFALVLTVGVVAAALANPQRQALLDGFAAQAKAEDGNFKGFSSERGKELFQAKHVGGKPETPSCVTCHTADPKGAGQTKAGKEIPPMAASRTPTRFTDPAELEKWFHRNCNQVLGRECTARERGDVIVYLSAQ